MKRISILLVFVAAIVFSFSSCKKDQIVKTNGILTGKVTEFLDPIFSSGVTLASVSAQGAARLVHKKLSGQAVDWESEYQLVCQKGVDVFRTYVEGWYDQKLHTIFFSKNQNENMRKQISSVLAGYVWDDSNPFVSQHKKYIEKLAQFLETRS